MARSRHFLLGLALAASCAGSVRAQDITSGLIGHWKLTETSGTTATDSSSSGRNGTYTNSVSLATSVTTPYTNVAAAKFDGFNDYVAVSGESTYDLTGSMTVSAWIRVDVWDVDFQGIVCKGNSAWRLARDGTSSLIQFACTGLSTIKVVTTSSVTTGQWRHIVGVYTGSQLRIYVDGELENSVSVTGSISTNNYAVNIGRNEEVSGREFDGAIYDVRVYNRALSTTDIQYLYTQGLPTLHWKLDESSGTTANDDANLHDGSVSGTAAWIAARRHNGFDFNGSTKIEANTLLGQPTNFTLACWVRLEGIDSGGAEAISIGDYVMLRAQNGAAGPRGSFFNGSTYVAVDSPTSNLGVGWRHLAVTFDDATNFLRLYVDGVNVATTSTTSSISWTTKGTYTRLAQHGNGNTTFDLDGAMDDARIYNRALSAAEIIELYGLVGHWKLNETSGVAASDSSGIGNNGTVSGTATWSAAVRDNGFSAAYANGDDYVTIANTASLQNVQEDDYSIALWFKPNTTPPGVGYANDAIYGLTTKGTGFMGLGYTSGQVFAISHAFADGTFAQHWSPTIAPIQRFHHVAYTVNRAAGTIRFYLNGQLDSTTTFTANKTAYEQGTVPWRLGINIPGGASYRFAADGVLDDVYIYNRAIDAAEVSALFGLLGHWKMNEGAGTTVADSSGSGAHAAFNVGTPVWAAGAYGKALEFNGANDVVTNQTFTPPSEGTVSWWYRFGGFGATQQRHLGLGGDWEIRQEPTGVVYFDLGSDAVGGGFYTNSSFATVGQWRHVAAVYDCDDDTYAIYVDGELHKSGTSTNAMSPQTAAPLTFGTRTGATERFVGRLDDVRIYDRKLTQTDIRELFGLVGWYKFDELSGTLATDSSGVGNHGTYVGSPSLGAASNGAPSMGTAVDFNGSNYVQVPGLYDKPASPTGGAH